MNRLSEINKNKSTFKIEIKIPRVAHMQMKVQNSSFLRLEEMLF